MEKLDIRERIDRFVSTLPDVVAVKAYGSSIAYQSGYSKDEKKQVDLIVIVDDIKKFYAYNLKKNGYMYHLVPKVYFSVASADQLKSGAGICYTSHINYMGDVFKMGAIEKQDVLNDLLHWNTFYMAGRFQKEMYTSVYDDDIELANKINKKNALIVALLMLDKEKPTTLDLYESLCSLSYMGDSRKKFKAEDPNKVKKLASGSYEYFNKEYRDKTDLFKEKLDGTIEIDYKKLSNEVDLLPSKLTERIYSNIS